MNRHDPGRAGRGVAGCTACAARGRGRPSPDGPHAEPAARHHPCHRRCRQAAPVRSGAMGGDGPGPGVWSVAFLAAPEGGGRDGDDGRWGLRPGCCFKS
ncbi:hypothetical protein G6F40_018094 [Rhizopus arrhizus]|nr:hypothetical protein G6F40_018094 [Rhizopus arrhizus]